MVEYKENSLKYTDYQRLRKAVGWMNFSAKQANEALQRSLYDITACADGKTVGMARLIGDGLYDAIVDVVVHPAYQGKGIGSEMINKLLMYAEGTLAEGGRLSIQLIAEKGKEGFYEGMGFKAIPHEHCGSGMRKVVFKMVGGEEVAKEGADK